MKAKLRRLLHRLFFAALILGTFVALFYAEENWRGARAWAAAKRDLAAQGESLDLKTLIPPPVPDDQNLAMAPLFVHAFQYQPDPTNGVLTFSTHKSGPGQYVDNPVWKELASMFYGPNPPLKADYPKSNARWSNGHQRNLAAWQRFYRQNDALPHTPQPQTPAEDVLLALSRYDAPLDELAQAAAARPYTRFPINWTLRPASNIGLPQENLLQIFALTLDVRASARLAAGQVASARQDCLLALRLADGLSREPVLIATLTEFVCLDGVMQPIWEGLEKRQWSADDLKALQERLAGFDPARNLRDALRVERAAFFVQIMEDMQNPAAVRQWIPQLAGPSSDDPPDTFWKAVRKTLGIPDSPRRALWDFLPYAPRGWFMQNSAFGSHLFQRGVIDPIDVNKGFVHPEESLIVEQQRERLPLRPGNFLAKEVVPIFASSLGRIVRTQAALNEAVTACALERYFLDHGDYPATLAELVPAYLDRVRPDPVDGAPLRYRRTVDGRFLLYSIGSDRHDDGGALEWPPARLWRHGDSPYVGEKPYGLPRPDDTRGDWIWQYAPAEPPDPPANTSRLEARP